MSQLLLFPPSVTPPFGESHVSECVSPHSTSLSMRVPSESLMSRSQRALRRRDSTASRGGGGASTPLRIASLLSVADGGRRSSSFHGLLARRGTNIIDGCRCDGCDGFFVTAEALAEHMIAESHGTWHACRHEEGCEARFSTERMLRAHMLDMHGTPDTDIVMPIPRTLISTHSSAITTTLLFPMAQLVDEGEEENDDDLGVLAEGDNAPLEVSSVFDEIEALDRALEYCTACPLRQEDDALRTDATCSVCLGEATEVHGDRQGCCLPCRHVFHVDCVAQWLYRNWSCPNCRMPLRQHADSLLPQAL